MDDRGSLSPREAAYIAHNAYFTLKDWVNADPKNEDENAGKPVAGMESRSIIKDRVTGSGTKGHPGHAQSSLGQLPKSAPASSGKLGRIHTAETGLGTTSGFGYTLTFEKPGEKHVVIATRGTRPEMGALKPDVLTDLRGTLDPFGDYGPVHKGFSKTFDSIAPQLARDANLIASANYVHCVGHSLGGGVATLIAASYAAIGKNVKLYTFGGPRVGALGTHQAFHKKIGQENIYRVSHDLDPITMIGPFPYIHVNPSSSDPNNLTLKSPFGSLGMSNHDMAEYINKMGEFNWAELRGAANRVKFDDAMLARQLLGGGSGEGWWVQEGSIQTLTLLFKLFRYVLGQISTSVLLGLTAVDLLAEILMAGVRMLGKLGSEIISLLRYAAQWAGIRIAEGANFTMDIIRTLLLKMLSALRTMANEAVQRLTSNTTPMKLMLAGGLVLTAATAF